MLNISSKSLQIFLNSSYNTGHNFSLPEIRKSGSFNFQHEYPKVPHPQFHKILPVSSSTSSLQLSSLTLCQNHSLSQRNNQHKINCPKLNTLNVPYMKLYMPKRAKILQEYSRLTNEQLLCFDLSLILLIRLSK